MKENAYNAAEVMEIGNAEDIILGQKVDVASLEHTGGEPFDRLYVE